MAQLGEVGAKTEDKKNKDETSQVEMELFLSVIFDGCVNCQVQKAQHDAYRNSQSLNIDTSQEPTLSFSGNDNTNIAPSPNAMVENDLIKHETIIIDMSTGSGYADRVSRIRQQIERSAQQYYEKPNVKKLTVHLYLFFYRQCDPAVNLLGDLAPTDEGDAKKKIKQLFAKKLFDNKKVKYQGIEYIGSFDPADEDFSRKVDNGDPTDMNAPTEQDVLDAAVLCQFTYGTQKANDRSFIESVIGAVKSLFGKDKEKVYTNKTPITNDMGEEIGWKLMPEADVSGITSQDKGFKLKSTSSGLFSQLFYYSTPASSKQKTFETKYAYCTAGTNVLSIADWFSNIAQGLIGWAPQYVQSVRNAKILDKSLKDYPLIFIGHSLGGGLASNNALVTQTRHAITFNAAGLNVLRTEATLLINNRDGLFHIASRRSRIHPYIIRGEVLHVILGMIGQMPYGYDKEHSYVADETSFINKVRNTVDRHGLDGFIKGVLLKETLIRNRA
jgi:hypothetical protein